MANGLEPTQLQQIATGLQGFGAGIQGQGPQFLAQQAQAEQLRSQQAEKQRQNEIERERSKFVAAESALKFAKEGNFKAVQGLGVKRLQALQAIGSEDPSDTQRLTQLSILAEQGDKEAGEQLTNELQSIVDVGVVNNILERPEEKERKIIKDVEGRQRFVDDQELVFPDVEIKEKEVKPEKITGPQRMAAAFAQRTTEAGDTITELGSEFTGVLSRGAGLVPRGAQSDERQKFDQAVKNFVNATLRRESGAAIADSEFENANVQYIPQPGDGEEVLKQKQRNRETISTALELEAGEAFTQLSEALKEPLSGSIKVMGKDVQVGSIVTNSKGQRGRVEQDGSITVVP